MTVLFETTNHTADELLVTPANVRVTLPDLPLAMDADADDTNVGHAAASAETASANSKATTHMLPKENRVRN